MCKLRKSKDFKKYFVKIVGFYGTDISAIECGKRSIAFKNVQKLPML